MPQRVPPLPPETTVDPSARSIGMLGFGTAGMRVVRRWIEQVPAETPVTWAAAQRADAVSLAELERLVSSARVGWRLMLAGPEADVAAACAAATAQGLLDAQIRTVITAQELRRVWCPHCTATTETELLPGEQVHCSGCTVPLRLPAAVSRALGAHAATLAEDEPETAHHVA